MKRLLTSLLVLLIISASFAQEKEPKFEKQGDLVHATYYHDNGSIKEIGFFKDGKLHNEWTHFNVLGEKITVAQYSYGIKTGKWYIISKENVKELTYNDNKLIKVEELDYSEYISSN